MNVFLLAVVVAALVKSAGAEEDIIPGSESPDHTYAIYAVDPRVEGGVAGLEVRNKRTGKAVFDLGASGWVETASALAQYKNVVAVWNSTGSFFALKVREAKTSAYVTAYRIDHGICSKLPRPNFEAIVRKTLGFKFDGRFYFEAPVKWENPQKIQIEIQGNTVDSIDPDGEYTYDCTLVYDVTNGDVSDVHIVKNALPPPVSK